MADKKRKTVVVSDSEDDEKKPPRRSAVTLSDSESDEKPPAPTTTTTTTSSSAPQRHPNASPLAPAGIATMSAEEQRLRRRIEWLRRREDDWDATKREVRAKVLAGAFNWEGSPDGYNGKLINDELLMEAYDYESDTEEEKEGLYEQLLHDQTRNESTFGVAEPSYRLKELRREARAMQNDLNSRIRRYAYTVSDTKRMEKKASKKGLSMEQAAEKAGKIKKSVFDDLEDSEERERRDVIRRHGRAAAAIPEPSKKTSTKVFSKKFTGTKEQLREEVKADKKKVGPALANTEAAGAGKEVDDREKEKEANWVREKSKTEKGRQLVTEMREAKAEVRAGRAARTVEGVDAAEELANVRAREAEIRRLKKEAKEQREKEERKRRKKARRIIESDSDSSS